MAGVCPYFWSGRRLAFRIGFGYAERLRRALLPHMMYLPLFLSLQLNLCLPQTNYHQVNLLHFRRRTETAHCFFSTERVPQSSLSEQESALLLSLLVSCVTQVVLQLLLFRLSLLVLQEIVRHGCNIAQLQLMPKAANFQ